MFLDHAHQLTEVGELACSMSDNEEGVSMVKAILTQLQQVIPQVVNAAKLLVLRPKSKVITSCSLFYVSFFKNYCMNSPNGIISDGKIILYLYFEFICIVTMIILLLNI